VITRDYCQRIGAVQLKKPIMNNSYSTTNQNPVHGGGIKREALPNSTCMSYDKINLMNSLIQKAIESRAHHFELGQPMITAEGFKEANIAQDVSYAFQTQDIASIRSFLSEAALSMRSPSKAPKSSFVNGNAPMPAPSGRSFPRQNGCFVSTRPWNCHHMALERNLG
jgi:hypothetical protein